MTDTDTAAGRIVNDTNKVQGKCPSCGWTSLFLGDGGYVTCSSFDCKDPTAAHDALDGGYEAMRRAVEFLEILADGGELLVNGVPWREMFRRFNAIVADGVVLDA